MRYTAMAWMRRANMAALGGGADIMPDDLPLCCPNCEQATEHGELCIDCEIRLTSMMEGIDEDKTAI